MPHPSKASYECQGKSASNATGERGVAISCSGRPLALTRQMAHSYTFVHGTHESTLLCRLFLGR